MMAGFEKWQAALLAPPHGLLRLRPWVNLGIDAALKQR